MESLSLEPFRHFPPLNIDGQAMIAAARTDDHCLGTGNRLGGGIMIQFRGQGVGNLELVFHHQR